MKLKLTDEQASEVKESLRKACKDNWQAYMAVIKLLGIENASNPPKFSGIFDSPEEKIKQIGILRIPTDRFFNAIKNCVGRWLEKRGMNIKNYEVTLHDNYVEIRRKEE